jgi:MoxR-like ATPase
MPDQLKTPGLHIEFSAISKDVLRRRRFPGSLTPKREEIHPMPEQLSAASPEPDAAQESLERALFEIKRVIAGQDEMLERVLVCLLADGHLLIEGVPGLAKTLTIKTTAQVLGGTFNRIQFTPDLMPSDLVGTRVFRPHDGAFDVDLGPVFCNFLLADEINRAPAKVQSALLEVMQERQVTIGKETFAAPSPFLVMATQNPIESEGTYPLPEAQVDRFMLKVVVGYPGPEDELTVVERSLAGLAEVRSLIDLDELISLREAVKQVYVDPALSRYAVQVAGATRDPESVGLLDLKAFVAFGASPRGPISLMAAARALALIRGRDYVLPQDVRELARDALQHRIVLSYEALAAEVAPESIVESVLEVVPMPELDLVERAA